MSSEDTARAFDLRTWESGDDAVTARLLAAGTRVDGRPDPGVDWFEWKMAQSPWGRATVVYAVDRATGDVAGVVAFGAWRFWHQREQVPAALSYETFVVPAYQRRGLFTTLARAAFDRLRRQGIALVVNFPNASSLPGFVKLGFTRIDAYGTWIRPRGIVAAARFARGILRGDRTGRAETASASAPSSTWISAAARTAALAREFPVAWASVRDEAMLAWRYATRPACRYVSALNQHVALLGRVEVRAGVRECRIVEAATTWSPPRRAVADAAAELVDAAGADVLSAQLTAAHPIRRVLPQIGFVPVPDHINLCAYGLAGSVRVDDRGSWVMTAGDFHTT